MRAKWFPMFCALGFCASGASHVQADSAGPPGFVRQAYGASSDFARVVASEETLIAVPRTPRRVGAGRMAWITVEKSARPSLAELDALLNPPSPEYETLEQACAQGHVAFPFDGSRLQASPLQDSPLQDRPLETVLGQVTDTDGRVVVVGHADGVGSDAYNCRLGLKRAQAVAAWFVAHGIARERIALGSRGKREPVADNRSQAGRARNRRAAVWVHVMGEGQGTQP